MKYCTYCDKHSHNDSECWSTRALNYTALPAAPLRLTLCAIAVLHAYAISRV